MRSLACFYFLLHYGFMELSQAVRTFSLGLVASKRVGTPSTTLTQTPPVTMVTLSVSPSTGITLKQAESFVGGAAAILSPSGGSPPGSNPANPLLRQFCFEDVVGWSGDHRFFNLRIRVRNIFAAPFGPGTASPRGRAKVKELTFASKDARAIDAVLKVRMLHPSILLSLFSAWYYV
jgi:hypothetical protein